VRAAKSALAKVEQMILSDHLGSCVEDAIASGDPAQQREKVAELIEVLGRSGH
jgi:DNA-binding FrmR family transcriptional regulator